VSSGISSSPLLHQHRFLLQPLKALDRQQGREQVVVVLLDALDEATDGNKGWEPVTSLVANQ